MSSRDRRRRQLARKIRFRKFFVERLEDRRLLAADLDGHDDHQEDDHGDGIDIGNGEILFIDPQEPAELAAQGPLPSTNDEGGDTTGPAGAPLSDTFKLHSNPKANHTIYLDFDGHTTTGTTWNSWSGRPTIVSPAYDPSGDGPTFNTFERQRIQRIWQRVAEDFSMFEVNVTTEDPGPAALSKTGGSDTEWGSRVVITVDWHGCSCGGFAFLESFNDSVDEPAFVFTTSEIGVSAASSHEVGHALGLHHDGVPGSTYYDGHGFGEHGWGPIMGSGYYKNVTTWDAGDYRGSTNAENDWQIISTRNGFHFRGDDHGDDETEATPLDFTLLPGGETELSGYGIIEKGDDHDWFTFEASAGTADIIVQSYVNAAYINNGTDFDFVLETDLVYPLAEQGSNLDVEAILYDADLNEVAVSNLDPGLSAEFLDIDLDGGDYFIRIDGVGYADWTRFPPQGYDDSVSRGQYMITGNVPSPNLLAINDAVITPENTAIDIDVLANDIDPQGGVITITGVDDPVNGTATIGAGLITYTPDPGFNGTDVFNYQIEDDQGDTATGTISVRIFPQVLLVDDDQNDSLEEFYIDALVASGRGHNVWDVHNQGLPDDAELAQYGAVIWSSGRSAGGLSPAEQTLLTTYLDNGGAAFIAGQNILNRGVSPTFQSEYLQVESFRLDVINLARLQGVGTSTISDDMILPYNFPQGFVNEFADIIAPTENAEGVFYRNITNANPEPYHAISYEGDTYRTVFMAAPFEGISDTDDDPNNQKTVIDRIMRFLLQEDNAIPIATDNTYVVDVNTPYSGNLITDPVPDSDADGDPLEMLTTPVSGPEHGSVVLNPDGSFTYTPPVDFNGIDTFVYRITDGNGGLDNGLVRMLVGDVNFPPEPNDDDYETREDIDLTGNVLANDSDPDGDPLTVNVNPVVDVEHGTLQLSANGQFIYEPDQDFHGEDSFVYEVADDRDNRVTATVNITVTSVNDAPQVDTPSDITVFQDSQERLIPLTSVHAGGGELQAMTITATSSAPHIVPHPIVQYSSPKPSGELFFQPSPGMTGEAIITITISDDGGTDNGGVDTYSTSFKVTVDLPPENWLYFSAKGTGELNGFAYDRQDIIGYDGSNFNKFFDGSRYFPGQVIDGFAITPNNELLFSFTTEGVVEGVSYDDSDIVLFDPQLHTWQMFFDGSDVGLTRNGEDIDGFSLSPNGDLLISTNGSARVGGVQSGDEDILVFHSTSFGPDTSGTWAMYFDGSDVGLADTSSEDVDAFSVASNGHVYFSTIGNFHVANLMGADEDVGRFEPTQTGEHTSGLFGNPLAFDGSVLGFLEDIGGMHVHLPGDPSPGPGYSIDDSAAAASNGEGEGEAGPRRAPQPSFAAPAGKETAFFYAAAYASSQNQRDPADSWWSFYRDDARSDDEAWLDLLAADQQRRDDEDWLGKIGD